MTADKNLPNYCFIDGQNLHLGTQAADPPWRFDIKKFRKYLSDKYRVTKAYYFVGLEQKQRRKLYKILRDAGYIVVFTSEYTNHKGNADMDIVLEIMKKLVHEPAQFDKFILVSGDGDFKQLIDYLLQTDRLEKIMFPCKQNASSLYNKLQTHQFENLSQNETREKIILE